MPRQAARAGRFAAYSSRPSFSSLLLRSRSPRRTWQRAYGVGPVGSNLTVRVAVSPRRDVNPATGFRRTPASSATTRSQFESGISVVGTCPDIRDHVRIRRADEPPGAELTTFRSKSGIVRSARPRWTSMGRFQASASCGRASLRPLLARGGLEARRLRQWVGGALAPSGQQIASSDWLPMSDATDTRRSSSLICSVGTR